MVGLGGCLLYLWQIVPQGTSKVLLSPAAAAYSAGSHYGKLIFALEKHNKAVSAPLSMLYLDYPHIRLTNVLLQRQL